MEQKKHNILNEAEYQKHIREIYQNMIDEIEKEINGFYGKYARKEGITISEAKKRASKLDIEAYSRKAAKYVKEKNFSDQANEEMRIYNMTMKVNRLELLKANIGLEMVSGFDELQKYYDEILTDRTLREFERQAGILGETVIDNKKMAHAIVNASFHNATYSDRIWMYQDLLKSELSGLLQTGLIRGQNPRKLATHLRKRFGVSQSNAERLMITELARVQTEAQKQSVEANGYDEFQFHALGSACDQCKELNGKHFPVTNLVIAKNAPPMHPRCRCSISAYMDRQEFDQWLDFLDKGGTTEEWNKSKRGKVQIGGKESTGGKWYTPYDEDDTRDIAASKAYREISRRNDIKTIAANTGFSEKDIKQIKRHIFYDKHQTYNGYNTLYPDYDMAVAWNRLYKGEQLERDILLLNHELLESTLEKEYNLTIAEAHARASKRYDWAEKIAAELGMDGEPDGLL